ncbi:MAG: hypothetical protein WAM64_10360, partial [Acidimicrobiales bacterium]
MVHVSALLLLSILSAFLLTAQRAHRFSPPADVASISPRAVPTRGASRYAPPAKNARSTRRERRTQPAFTR